MFNLFYYCSMGLLWLLVLFVVYRVTGWMFWPLVGYILVASVIGGWLEARKSQPPRN